MPDFILRRTPYTKGGRRGQSRYWSIEFRDHHEIPHRLATGLKVERDADSIGRSVMELVRIRRRGDTLDTRLGTWIDRQPKRLVDHLIEWDIIDRIADEFTLLEHLLGKKDADGHIVHMGYYQFLEGRNRGDRNARQQTTRIKRTFEACGLTYWQDLRKPSAITNIATWLGRQRGIATSEGIVGTTYNAYVTALRGFGNWMHKKAKRVQDNPLADLEPVNNAAIDKTERSALSFEELDWLMRVTRSEGVVRFHVPSSDRADAYLFHQYTGIRPGQARELRVADFQLNARPPIVKSLAKDVKTGKAQVLELHDVLAAALRERFTTKLPESWHLVSGRTTTWRT